MTMGIMDEINASTAPGKSDFLKGGDRDTMVVTKQPFNVLHVRFRTSTRFKDPKTDKFRDEWLLDLRFLDTSGNVAEIDDGEGGKDTVDRTLSLTSTDYRSRVMPQIKTLVENYAALGHKDGLGPFYLYKQRVEGQANPAYMIGDWPPVAKEGPAMVTGAPVPPPPPPSDRMRSPDGKWEWWPEKNQWLPVAQVIARDEPVSPEPPTVIRAEVPGTIPFSRGAELEPPAPGKSQPLPTVTKVRGGDGEGGMVEVEHATGSEIRQAVYRGDGVVQTPAGGLVQMATETTPAPPTPGVQPILSPDGKFYLENGKWIKLPPLPSDHAEEEAAPVAPTLVPAELARNQEMEARGIASEPPPPPPPSIPPPPPDAPPEAGAAVGQAQPKAKRKTIPMSAKCDTCGKKVQGAAFKNSKERWILTHTCDAPDPAHPGQKIGARTVDVHDQVTAILQEATS